MDDKQGYMLPVFPPSQLAIQDSKPSDPAYIHKDNPGTQPPLDAEIRSSLRIKPCYENNQNPYILPHQIIRSRLTYSSFICLRSRPLIKDISHASFTRYIRI
jgi:hypothetical protein